MVRRMGNGQMDGELVEENSYCCWGREVLIRLMVEKVERVERGRRGRSCKHRRWMVGHSCTSEWSDEWEVGR